MASQIPERSEYIALMKNRALGLSPEMGSAIRMAEIINRLAGRQDHIALADVGCAGGHYLRSVLKRLPQSTSVSYSGIDVDQGMLTAAREAWQEVQREFPLVTTKFILSDAERVGDLGLQADIVFCANAFMYIARPQLAVKGMLQMARSHCIIRSYFWNQTFIVKRANEEFLDDSGEPRTYDLWNIYSQELFERMVADASPKWSVRWEEDRNVHGHASMMAEVTSGIEKYNPTTLIDGQEVVYPFILPWQYAIVSKERG